MMGMWGATMAKPKDDEKPEIDERWIVEWERYGFEQMETYLKQHFAFDVFYERREGGKKETE